MEIINDNFSKLYIVLAAGFLFGGVILYMFFLKMKELEDKKRLSFLEKLSEYDGLCYFAFYKSSVECSRQLSLLLTLEKGTSSSFIDVLSRFNEVDATLITNAGLEDNVSLELKSKNNLWLKIVSRVFYDDDDNILARVLYFKDISEKKQEYEEIKEFGIQKMEESHILQGAVDAFPFPVFIRDNNLAIIYCNLSYVKDTNSYTKKNAISCGIEPFLGDGFMETRSLAAFARKTKTGQKKLCRGEDATGYKEKFINEIPFDSDNKIYSLGFYKDGEEVDAVNNVSELKSDIFCKILDLQNLGFAYFSEELGLVLFNNTFVKMWKLEENFLNKKPSYSEFLESLYQKKLVYMAKSFDEVKKNDFEMLKTKGMQIDQIMLSSGAYVDRIFVNNYKMGTIIIYKDVTEDLLNKRQSNNESNISNQIINNIGEGIAIFGANKTLKIYNKAFVNMWKMDKAFLDGNPLITEVFERKKTFFAEHGNWYKAKESLLRVIDGEGVIVEVGGNKAFEIQGTVLPDGGIMISYNDVSESFLEKMRNIEMKDSIEIKKVLLSVLAFESKNAINKNISLIENINANTDLSIVANSMAHLKDSILNSVDLIAVDTLMTIVAPDVVDVKNMLIYVLELVRGKIIDKNIDISFDCPDAIDWITIDEKLIKQMLLYVFANTIASMSVNSKINVSVLKSKKSDIVDNQKCSESGDLYLVIAIEVEGDFIKNSLDFDTLKANSYGNFGTNNRLIRKILRTFEGFFVEESNHLKICLPYHK